MTQSFRVDGRGRLDYGTPMRFTFDGKTYSGFKGDTLASALLAHGVHLVGRSFKYHRPRGIVTAGSEEPNALVGIDRGAGRFEPNTRATVQELYQGLSAESQNRWPSLQFDIGAINDQFHSLFPAGFYYKTFMWPRQFWDRVYEPFIRFAAGLGRPPRDPDPDCYASRYHHCDLLIVGGGPAGLAAALEAGRQGLDVVIVDEQAAFGGSLLSNPTCTINGALSWEWIANVVEELRGLENVKLLLRTSAIGYFHQNMVGLCQRLTDHLSDVPDGVPRERLWRVRARRVILAQGAIEKPLVFNGNDRPGVMLASAGQTYLHRYGVTVGKRIVIVTSHDTAWQAAFDYANAGIEIAAIVDVRPEVDPKLRAKADECAIKTLVGHSITQTTGRKRVRSVTVQATTDPSRKSVRRLLCDAVLMSGGWTPTLYLFSHTKGSLTWDDNGERFLPSETPEICDIIGAGNGCWGIANALREGACVGAGKALTDIEVSYTVEHDDDAASGIVQKELPTTQPQETVRAFVDFQNDVTSKDIRLAVQTGMKSIEHVKRYTTNGMATDQGKLSNMNGLMIAADALGVTPPDVGLTTFRPPYTPTTFGVFAGRHSGEHFEVERKTVIDPWADEQGAVFEPVSLWRRARYFPQAGEDMRAAVARECGAVRSGVGIFDASTLGKIEVVGPDAAEFLNRMYTNPWLKLAPGRCRYGLLLGEDGYIRDDGVVARLSQDRFHVTTTTGGAPNVLATMEDYLQTEWPDLDVWLTSTTEQWAVIALQGPLARKVLEPLVDGIDLSNDAFPHMSMAQCSVAGYPARLFRVSFTGELGFEVNVPAQFGRALWERFIEAGEPHSICPYGTEAMHVLRTEKGYIIVGQDTDGTVTPDDAGLNWAIGKKKKDFIGKRSLSRPDLVADGRKQFVGLLTHDPSVVLEEGAQVVQDPNQSVPMDMLGHITSSYWSEALGRSIALALIADGRARMDQSLYIPMDNQTHAVTVVSPVFYDPSGERLNS
ncbi:MAG: sarcosine oxidase subunit alpha [Pseudomonadota bacterium]